MNARTILVAVLGILTLCGSAWAMEGMVSHWKFDEGSGTTAYDSVGNNDGTIYGAVWTTGQINGALSFDGVGDYVDCASDMSLNNINSVSFWFKPETKSGYNATIIGQHATNADRWAFCIYEAANGLYLFSDGYDLLNSDPGSVSPGNWYHAAITWDGSIGKMYVDGIQQTQTSTTSFFDVIDPEVLSIGIHFYHSIPSTPYGFNGRIDDVMIFDITLFAEEVQQLYENGLAGYAKIIATRKIERAIAEKLGALDKVNAALEEEWVAYEALQELFESGDYGDLDKGDIVTVMQKVYSAIQHQEQSINALEKSIEKLKDALAAIGWQPPSPLSHWKFDEGIGTTAYDSAGTNDGSIYGATWTTGQIDGALSFDGVGDYVDCASDMSLNNINSVSFWFKPETKSGYLGSIISQYGTNADRWVFLVDEAATGLQVWVDGYLLLNSDAGSVSPGNWYHAAITWDGSIGKMYVDGIQQTETTTTSFFDVIDPEVLSIGIHFYSSIPSTPYGFNGKIDDVMIFDRALPAQEIQQLYNNALAGL